jgi:peptide/nickel transport system substrate-binding protein
MFTGVETPSYAEKALQLVPNPRAQGKELLNAKLAFLDENGLPFPVLAETLPQLNTDTWRVFPDGRMETTYRLKPNLTWHDGHPLTAEDFAFAGRVYATPAYAVRSGGFQYVEEVAAPDSTSVVVRWKQPYPDAVDDVAVVPPLPRHLLEQPYQEANAEAFLSLPFWTYGYVGAGPWKLDRREPGTFFEATAFDGFVFGRPRIDRIRVIYIPDANISVTAMMTGEVHYAFTQMLYGEEGVTLERAWEANKAGTVLWVVSIGRAMEAQMRPQYAVPTQLATDARVRKALAYVIDREALLEIITSGKGFLRDVYTPPDADYYDAVLQAVRVRYRPDPRRAQALLEEAGFLKRADGAWLTPSGDRFTLELGYLTSASNEREETVMAEMLQRFGVAASAVLFGVQRTSNEERYTTPGLFGGNKVDARNHSREIAGPENRWLGANRWGYTNPEVDRIMDLHDMTLERPQRIQHVIRLEQIALEEDMPTIPLYFTASAVAHASNLKGVMATNARSQPVMNPRWWELHWES